LQERVVADRRWTAELRSRNAKLAARVAETERALAATLLRMARQQPHNKGVLMELSRAASEFAVKVWQRSRPDPR
jgi:hypothetical protein